MKELLPVGSIVKLNDILKGELMVMGYDKEYEGEIFDYIGVLYPGGFVNEGSCFVFNQETISEVVYTGYKND